MEMKMEVDYDGEGHPEGLTAVHRFNASLPPSYKHDVPAEGRRMMGRIIDTLHSFDIEKGDQRDLSRTCFDIERFYQLKHLCSDKDYLLIATKLHSLAFPLDGKEKLQVRCVNKVLNALTLTIGNKHGRLSLSGKFTMPWRPVYAALERAALRGFPLGSGKNEKSRLNVLLPFVEKARHYWDLGADCEIWDEVKETLRDVSKQEAFKALFILCRFLPTDTLLYEELLPEWASLWAKVDHCGAWHGTWLILLARARKKLSANFDWGPYLPDIYTMARASIRTPVSMGEAGSAPLPESRQVTYQYQAFAPTGSATPGKLAKLLVYLLGKGNQDREVEEVSITIIPPSDSLNSGSSLEHTKGDSKRLVSHGALSLLGLLRSLRTYFHPSNAGPWSRSLGLLLVFVCEALAKRIGEESTRREFRRSSLVECSHQPEDARMYGDLSKDDAALVIRALLPLVHEMGYSKDPFASALAQMSLALLASISPRTVAASSPDLILRALDPVSSVIHSHQAPEALRALVAIFVPLMYPRPYLAPYLPAMLELSLPGVDPNDMYKTVVTMELYRAVLDWIPVQGDSVSYNNDLTSWRPPPLGWLDSETFSHDDDTQEAEHLFSASEGLNSVMLDWALALLDRVFELLRHKSRPSKVKAGDLGQDTMGTAGAMAGLGMKRGHSGGGRGGSRRVMPTVINVVRKLFAQMDSTAFQHASARVLRFVSEEGPLPDAEKDCASLVEACAITNPVAVANSFFPVLCRDLAPPASAATINTSSERYHELAQPLWRWRLRLLSGLCRGCCSALVPHGPALQRLISGGLAHSDKGVRKAARKVLRKSLQGLTEIRLAEARSLPPHRWAGAHEAVEWRRLCEPLPREELGVGWVEPGRAELRLAAELMENFLVKPMRLLQRDIFCPDNLGTPSVAVMEEELSLAGAGGGAWEGKSVSLLRENLKTMEYALRGCVCLLADLGVPGDSVATSIGGAGGELRDDALFAVGNCLLSRLKASSGEVEGRWERGKEDTRLHNVIAGLRAEMVTFVRHALEVCAADGVNVDMDNNVPTGRAASLASTDVKVTKLVVGLALRLSCSRSSHNSSWYESVTQGLAWRKRMQYSPLAYAAAEERLKPLLMAARQGDAGSAANARTVLLAGSMLLPTTRGHALHRAFHQHNKRLAHAPRAIAFATKDWARLSMAPAGNDKSGLGSGGGIAGESCAEVMKGCRPITSLSVWPGAKGILDGYSGVFSGLVGLSFSEYATVRAAAQHGVERMGEIHPSFVYDAIPGLIDCITLGSGSDGLGGQIKSNLGSDVSSGSSIHRRLTGAMYLLFQKRSLRHVAGKWPLLRSLLCALCNSQAALGHLPTDKQEKAAARVQILFASYVASWRANPIRRVEDQKEYEQLMLWLLDHLGMTSISTQSTSSSGVTVSRALSPPVSCSLVTQSMLSAT
ncbi:unnamed protein product [Choristocarpus tenellus]